MDSMLSLAQITGHPLRMRSFGGVLAGGELRYKTMPLPEEGLQRSNRGCTSRAHGCETTGSRANQGAKHGLPEIELPTRDEMRYDCMTDMSEKLQFSEKFWILGRCISYGDAKGSYETATTDNLPTVLMKTRSRKLGQCIRVVKTICRGGVYPKSDDQQVAVNNGCVNKISIDSKSAGCG